MWQSERQCEARAAVQHSAKLYTVVSESSNRIRSNTSLGFVEISLEGAFEICASGPIRKIDVTAALGVEAKVGSVTGSVSLDSKSMEGSPQLSQHLAMGSLCTLSLREEVVLELLHALLSVGIAKRGFGLWDFARAQTDEAANIEFFE